jgi:hypothetical protein
MTESEIAKDYADASNYLTDFYSIREALLEDYADASRDAVFNFFLYAGIKEEKVDFNIYGVLAEVTFLVAPNIGIIKAGVSKFIKFAKGKIKFDFLDELDKNKVTALAGAIVGSAEEKAKEAIKSIGASGDSFNDSAVRHFAGKAMQEATLFKSFLRASVIYERAFLRQLLSNLFDNDSAKRGTFKALTTQLLGQMPDYSVAGIIYIGKQFELELYRKFYEKTAYIKIEKIISYGSVKEESSVVGIPEAVQKRILEIMNIPNIRYALGFWNLKTVRTQVNNIGVGW